ncbi:MAG: type II toxin-antitoxin system VapC family toxin [Parvibaculum sp.]
MAGTVAVTISSSSNHFIDTNVLLKHANDDSGEFSADIETILSEAAGSNPKRTLWVSSVLFGELRPSSLRPGKFEDIEGLAKYIRSIATVVAPDPYAMLRAARLRDLKWTKPPEKRGNGELVRGMTLGDAIHIASALWVKEGWKVGDLEFLTFDNSSDKSIETDPGTKSLPLLSLDKFTYEIGNDPDVLAVVRLPRLKPVLKQGRLDV